MDAVMIFLMWKLAPWTAGAALVQHSHERKLDGIVLLKCLQLRVPKDKWHNRMFPADQLQILFPG
jgi:hypothetical protein